MQVTHLEQGYQRSQGMFFPFASYQVTHDVDSSQFWLTLFNGLFTHSVVDVHLGFVFFPVVITKTAALNISGKHISVGSMPRIGIVEYRVVCVLLLWICIQTYWICPEYQWVVESSGWPQCLWMWWKRDSELLLQAVLGVILGGSVPSLVERLSREPFALPCRRVDGVCCLGNCSGSCGREPERREGIF